MTKKVRYAVLGLGHIAQTAVLPAFAHARGSSVLAALISSDVAKLRTLGRKYGVERLYSYEQFDDCMTSGEIDALYIALPNHLHAEYTIQAAARGIHVLCEKPMAVTETECRSMIRACARNDVRLMVAYRLHFEKANLSTIQLVQSGKIGEARLFDSVFTMDVRQGNIRLRAETGGGTLYDIGIYCINAARNLFRDEPIEVWGAGARRDDPRFAEVEEMFSATLRFPGDRMANLICSFGAADCGEYRVVGTKGHVRLDPAYEYAADLKQYVTTGGEPRERVFAKRDQFAPELAYFSGCVQRGVEPEPSGWEGLADVRVIEALYRSASKERLVALAPFEKSPRPSESQEIHRPPVDRPPTSVKSKPPSR
ncbi:MAG: putative glucose-fructose oxidoreductase oxidoreductase protein [Acidobacteria bacterium]|nr:putative glucose-fructose oxidoreductase oxidoreductase protein [Acidobacteriota bacterium]